MSEISNIPGNFKEHIISVKHKVVFFNMIEQT